MALPDPYLVHWVDAMDQPHYPLDADVFRLYEPTGRQVIVWLPGEHIPCWLDFLPNRDCRAVFYLKRGNGISVDVPAGPLRQRIREVMWRLEPVAPVP